MNNRAYQKAWLERKKKAQRASNPTEWRCPQCWEPTAYKVGSRRGQICTDCAPNDRFRSLVKRYGVDQHMWNAMYFEQDGKCAIESCFREARSVDHNHRTGELRGLLCQGCNVAVGFIESAHWLTDALDYLAS